jgi:N6-L-threonylcarbamoyladenine synthase
MIILGVETSCDETAAAIVKDGKTVLSSTVASSQELHTKTGGIIPERAAREQINSIIPVIQEALTETNITDIDAIAVTYGPGLIGSLLVGVEAAKTLSLVWNKPIIPVNHLVAHIYANWAGAENPPQFPAFSLVVSGGHTDLVYLKSHGEIEYIGGTRDDAAGEAFDKTARLIGLPYPGGPSISAEANNYKNERLELFPRPMINDDNFDMSFSGLKTAVSTYIKNNSDYNKPQIAAEIQEAIVDTLVSKSKKAIEKYSPKSFLLAGGVSANLRLREKFKDLFSREKYQTKLFIPTAKYSTDNAVMIASAAFYNNNPIPWQDVSANPSLSIEN